MKPKDYTNKKTVTPDLFKYKVTLLDGSFTYINNGIHLDKVIKGREKFVMKIEVIDVNYFQEVDELKKVQDTLDTFLKQVRHNSLFCPVKP